MQTRLGISGVVLVLTAGLSVQIAAACPRDSVAAAVEKWASSLPRTSRRDPGTLFQGRGVVGHALPMVRSDPAALKAYFVGAFQACRRPPSSSETS